MEKLNTNIDKRLVIYRLEDFTVEDEEEVLDEYIRLPNIHLNSQSFIPNVGDYINIESLYVSIMRKDELELLFKDLYNKDLNYLELGDFLFIVSSLNVNYFIENGNLTEEVNVFFDKA